MILKKLVKRDEFYSIRIKIGENKYIKSSIKAVRRISFFFGQKFIIYSQKCSLISSELRDYIGLHMSQQGDLISLNYWTKTIECSNELIVTFVVDPKVFFFLNFSKNSGRFDSFTTEINIKFGTSGGLSVFLLLLLKYSFY